MSGCVGYPPFQSTPSTTRGCDGEYSTLRLPCEWPFKNIQHVRVGKAPTARDVLEYPPQETPGQLPGSLKTSTVNSKYLEDRMPAIVFTWYQVYRVLKLLDTFLWVRSVSTARNTLVLWVSTPQSTLLCTLPYPGHLWQHQLGSTSITSNTRCDSTAWPHVAEFGAPEVDQERLVVGLALNLHLLVHHVVRRNIVMRHPWLHMEV